MKTAKGSGSSSKTMSMEILKESVATTVPSSYPFSMMAGIGSPEGGGRGSSEDDPRPKQLGHSGEKLRRSSSRFTNTSSECWDSSEDLFILIPPDVTTIATSPEVTAIATSPEVTEIATSPDLTAVATSPDVTAVASPPDATSPDVAAIGTSPNFATDEAHAHSDGHAGVLGPHVIPCETRVDDSWPHVGIR